MTSGVQANQIYYGYSPTAYAPSSSTSSTVGQLEHGFIQSFLGWGGRISAGRAIDEVYHSKQGISSAAPRAGTSYAQILGLSEPYLLDGSKNPSYTGTKANLSNLKPSQAWARISQGEINGRQFSVGRYAKETLWDYNLKGITNIKADPGGSIARGLGLAYLGWGVASDTKTGYDAAKAKHGDNNLAVGASTIGSFAGSAVKAGASWEVSNLLYDIGQTTLPKLTIAKIPFGGIILGALGAVATGIVLDKIIPSPEAPAGASKNSDSTYLATQNVLKQGNPFINQAQASYGLAI